MKNISYKPEGAWVGDVIPFYEDDVYYAYYLHDPRSGEAGHYAENTTWHLVTTEDGLTFKSHGEAIPMGNEDTPYLNNYTGSVVKGKDSRYYAFFTAFNEAYQFEGKAVQSVMVAVGDTPYDLQIDDTFRLLADNDIYEMYDWRDPYVFYNDAEACYWMLLCARKCGASAHRGGCIALCKSQDLKTWTYEKPFYEPNMYITMECPEVFRMGEWWYLVFSTFSDRFVTHYRKAKSLDGKWIFPYEDTLDCRCDYAIKTAGDDQRRLAFGWISTRRDGTDFGSWEWGGTMIVHELAQDVDSGDLYVLPTKAMRKLFARKQELHEGLLVNGQRTAHGFSSEGLGAFLYPVKESCFEICTEVVPACAEFGLFVQTDTELECGYQLRFYHGSVCWDLWPRQAENGVYQWQIKGDVPYQIETLRYLKPGTDTFRIRLIRQEDIVIVYINDEVVLSTRLYDVHPGLTGLYVVNGDIRIDSYELTLQ